MAYNSFFVNILFRLLLLFGSFTGLAYLLVNTSRFFTIVFLIAITIFQIVSLIYFLNKTNKDLARFLLLLTAEDTSVLAWKDRVEKTFQGLHHSFRQVNEEINRIKLEKEKGNILLQNIIDHIHTGIFVVDEKEAIELINEEALKIFGVQNIERLKDLERSQTGLADEFSKLRYSSGNILHLMTQSEEEIPVIVRVSAFMLAEKKLKLFSIQGVRNEMEANEIESWQKLTRVLAHEISNSITPIATLGTGIHRKLTQIEKDEKGGLQLSSNISDDLIQSSELIETRSNSLVEFMEHYKSLTSLPPPVPEFIKVSAFFESLKLYFNDELIRQKIQLHAHIEDPDLLIKADRGLLEQAFINLIRNSLEAMAGQEDGCINLTAGLRKGNIILELSDNGPGIPKDIQSQVFIPFFTTKPGGSGIGMSIVRKIIIMNGGRIELKTKQGPGADFIIYLPAPDQDH